MNITLKQFAKINKLLNIKGEIAMERILKIEECYDVNIERENDYGYRDDYDGFKITTTEQEIYLLINNDQCCCEHWGYFMSEDELDKFINADLLEIKITDTLNNSVTSNKLKEEGLYVNENGSLDMYEGNVVFVDLITSSGALQFIAYNEHNGYYGHEASVISKQLNYDECL